LRVILQVAEDTERNSISWWENNDREWIVDRKPTSSGPGFCDHSLLFFDCYADLWAACVWNSYGAARMILRNTILESLDILLTSTSNFHVGAVLAASRVQYLKMIITMIEDIRASVPYVLGKVD